MVDETSDPITNMMNKVSEKQKAVVKKRKRFQRDTIIVSFALGMSAVEIAFLGARPQVFTFLAGILISPLVLRYDETRKEDNNE